MEDYKSDDRTLDSGIFFEKFSSPCWQHPPLLLLAAPGIFLSVSYTKLLVFSFIRPSSVKSLLSAKVFPLLVFKGGQDFSLEAHTGVFSSSPARLSAKRTRREYRASLSLSLCCFQRSHIGSPHAGPSCLHDDSTELLRPSEKRQREKKETKQHRQEPEKEWGYIMVLLLFHQTLFFSNRSLKKKKNGGRPCAVGRSAV